LLARDIDVVDVIHVDDQASTNTNKRAAHVGQLLANHILQLTQLEGHHANLTTRNQQIAVVAVRGDINNLPRCYTQQFVGSRYDEMSVHAVFKKSSAKVANNSEICKLLGAKCTK
jgi:hypothetical protein